MNDTNIGARIREIRQQADLSQAQLGEKIGFYAMGVSYLENGQRKAKIEDISKIAEALGVSMAYLLEPVASTKISMPSTTYARTPYELSEEQRHEVASSLKKFDEHVAALTKEDK